MRYAESATGRVPMSAEFETYAMRGAVAVMGAIIGAFIWREVKGKDALWKTVHKNREHMEAQLDEARAEFAGMLERVVARFTTSVDALNGTLATLSQSVARLEATVAKEYVSKAELQTVKQDLQREMDQHAENCPAKVRC